MGTAVASRVVLDTNVVVSILVFPAGPHAAFRLAWQDGTCRPMVSGATLAELMRVLAYPEFKLAPDAQEALLAQYLPYCDTVPIPETPPKTPACRDPDDVAFLQLAVVAKADCLVTSDKDLLVIGHRLGCPIVTPEKFLARATA